MDKFEKREKIIWCADEKQDSDSGSRVQQSSRGEKVLKKLERPSHVTLDNDIKLDGNVLSYTSRAVLLKDMSRFAPDIQQSHVVQHPDFQEYYETALFRMDPNGELDRINNLPYESKEQQMKSFENAVKGYAILAFVQDQIQQGKQIEDGFVTKWQTVHDERGSDGFKSFEARLAYNEFKTVVAQYDPCTNPIESELVFAYFRVEKYGRDISISKHIAAFLMYIKCAVRFNIHESFCRVCHPIIENKFAYSDKKANRRVTKTGEPMSTFQALFAKVA